MPRNNIAVAVNRHERSQPLRKIEALCCKYLDPKPPLTVGVPELLVVESAISESSQIAIWDTISDRALPGLLGIYALSIRRSSPLLEPCSAIEAQHHASVREALSKQLFDVLDPHRARQTALSILRSQSLRCYAVLLADAASSLLQQPSKCNKDSAVALLREVNSIAGLVARADESESDTGSPPSELLRTLQAEVLASSLLEHWARLLLTVAYCEGSVRAQRMTAVHLQRFSITLSAIMKRMDPGCARRLLASSPCLSYLLASQLVALCAVLDGGTLYGMPEAPGGVLAASVLQLRLRECDRSALVSLEAAVALASDTLSALPPLQGCRIPPGAKSAGVSQPTGAGDDAALAARVAPLAVPEAVTVAAAAGTITAESHTRDSGAAPSALAAAAPVPSEVAPGERPQSAGLIAASLQPLAATGQATAPPTLLLSPAVRLEVSLRLVAALCRKLAPAQIDAQDGIEGGHCPEAGQPRWLRQLREGSSSLPITIGLKRALSLPMMVGLRSAFNALKCAGQVLSNAELPHARPRSRRMATHHGGPSAAAARESVALSPLERWWGGAVALGRAVAGSAAAAAAAARAESELAQEFAGLVDNYFRLMDEVMQSQGESRVPLPQLYSFITAALNAGFLPCLERLLRAVLPLPLATEWVLRLGPGWNYAWARMLALADAGEVAAVVDAAAEGLRRAVAAYSAASRCQGGSTVGTARSASIDTHSAWQLESAAHLACHLTGNLALVWLPNLAGQQASEPSSPDGDGSDAAVRAGAARLGEALSLIATRLLPEISRALLGGLLPLFRRGVVGLNSAAFPVGWQLVWVPTLSAALARSAFPAAAAEAAADGSADGGGCSSGGGPCAARWRQLLFVELRLPSLLGAALELSLSGGAAEESINLALMRRSLRSALGALAVLVPADLARMVAAADRAEAAAACRTAASRSTAGAAGVAVPPSPSPPSCGLLRRALGPGGPLEDAELLAEVEAACAGRVGAGAGMPGGEEGKGATLPGVEELLLGARLLSL